jgi:hypothetical protein
MNTLSRTTIIWGNDNIQKQKYLSSIDSGLSRIDAGTVKDFEKAISEYDAEVIVLHDYHKFSEQERKQILTHTLTDCKPDTSVMIFTKEFTPSMSELTLFARMNHHRS